MKSNFVERAMEQAQVFASAWSLVGTRFDFGSGVEDARQAEEELRAIITEPVDMVLHCPKCHLQHIDAPDAEGDYWKNPPHKSHLCRPSDGGCGHIWRPADVPTNGVTAVKTIGKNDSPK